MIWMTIFLCYPVHIALHPTAVKELASSACCMDRNVHSPNEYVECLRAYIRDKHTVTRANLRKSTKRQKRGYGESSHTIKFQCGNWVWHVYPSVSGSKLHHRHAGP